MQEYINNIIARGLENGVSIDQMMANPELSAKAYLDSQIKTINNVGEILKKEGFNSDLLK